MSTRERFRCGVQLPLGVVAPRATRSRLPLSPSRTRQQGQELRCRRLGTLALYAVDATVTIAHTHRDLDSPRKAECMAEHQASKL